jgi:hypothetical protein
MTLENFLKLKWPRNGVTNAASVTNAARVTNAVTNVVNLRVVLLMLLKL